MFKLLLLNPPPFAEIIFIFLILCINHIVFLLLQISKVGNTFI